MHLIPADVGSIVGVGRNGIFTHISSSSVEVILIDFYQVFILILFLFFAVGIRIQVLSYICILIAVKQLPKYLH